MPASNSFIDVGESSGEDGVEVTEDVRDIAVVDAESRDQDDAADEAADDVDAELLIRYWATDLGPARNALNAADCAIGD